MLSVTMVFDIVATLIISAKPKVLIISIFQIEMERRYKLTIKTERLDHSHIQTFTSSSCELSIDRHEISCLSLLIRIYEMLESVIAWKANLKKSW
jgi:alkyl sulfatase BDS1-like metallo-beta-lactamase superfamily hydrolase